MNIALICIALLGFLVLGLGLNVVVFRGKTNTITGTINEPDNPLNKAIRAHGNTTEYAPILAVLIYVLAKILVFPATMAKPNPMRFIGALGTFVFGLALCVALVLKIMALG